MEQKKYKQIDTKTPEIQEMILSYQIGGVAYELAQRLNLSPAQALDMFYRSKTCAQLHDKRTGLYLMSNGYIADDFIMEMQRGIVLRVGIDYSISHSKLLTPSFCRKFKPTFTTGFPLWAKLSAYLRSLICCKASSALLSNFISIT